VPTPEQRSGVARAAEAHLHRKREAEPGQHRAETPAEIVRVQRAKLNEEPARLRTTGRGPDIDRLIAHLDPKPARHPGAQIAICIDARHAKVALDLAANKTDANDADELAHLAEVGFFREVWHEPPVTPRARRGHGQTTRCLRARYPLGPHHGPPPSCRGAGRR
jgi:hypothetical protein